MFISNPSDNQFYDKAADQQDRDDSSYHFIKSYHSGGSHKCCNIFYRHIIYDVVKYISIIWYIAERNKNTVLTCTLKPCLGICQECSAAVLTFFENLLHSPPTFIYFTALGICLAHHPYSSSVAKSVLSMCIGGTSVNMLMTGEQVITNIG